MQSSIFSDCSVLRNDGAAVLIVARLIYFSVFISSYCDPVVVESRFVIIWISGWCPQLPRNKTAANKTACPKFGSCNLHQEQRLA